MRTDTTRRLLAPAAAALASFAVAAPAMAAGGALDTTFGTSGTTLVDLTGNDDDAYGVALDATGGVILAGGDRSEAMRRFRLIRLDASGALDTAFGTDGKVATQMGIGGTAHAVAVQPDGKIVVVGDAGYESNPEPYFAIARYNADGTLDTTFDGDGKALVQLGNFGSDNGGDSRAEDLAILPDGDILVAGTALYNLSLPRATVVRLNGDGSLDTSFGGGDGKVDAVAAEDGSNSTVAAMAVDGQGRILVGGTANNSAGEDMSVVRFTAAGALDTTFGGGDGIVNQRVTPASYTEYYDDALYDLDVDDAGRIVAAGKAQHDVHEDALVRFAESGTLDTTFGDNGVVRVTRAGISEARTVLALPGGRILTGGVSGPNDIATLAAYTAAGAADTAFGIGGAVTTKVGTGSMAIEDLALSPDGTRVTAAGSDSYAFLAARYELGAAAQQQGGEEQPAGQEQPQQQQQSQQQAPPVATPPVVTPPVVTQPISRAPRCSSRRLFTIDLRNHGLRSGRVVALGARGRTAVVKALGRGRFRVDLRKRPSGTYRVKLTGRSTRGRKLTLTKTYRTCA